MYIRQQPPPEQNFKDKSIELYLQLLAIFIMCECCFDKYSNIPKCHQVFLQYTTLKLPIVQERCFHKSWIKTVVIVNHHYFMCKSGSLFQRVERVQFYCSSHILSHHKSQQTEWLPKNMQLFSGAVLKPNTLLINTGGQREESTDCQSGNWRLFLLFLPHLTHHMLMKEVCWMCASATQSKKWDKTEREIKSANESQLLLFTHSTSLPKTINTAGNFFPHLAQFGDIKVIGNEFKRAKRNQPWV